MWQKQACSMPELSRAPAAGHCYRNCRRPFRSRGEVHCVLVLRQLRSSSILLGSPINQYNCGTASHPLLVKRPHRRPSGHVRRVDWGSFPADSHKRNRTRIPVLVEGRTVRSADNDRFTPWYKTTSKKPALWNPTVAMCSNTPDSGLRPTFSSDNVPAHQDCHFHYGAFPFFQ